MKISELLRLRHGQASAGVPQIKVATVRFVPGWLLQLLCAVLLYLGVWTATGWMLDVPASMILGLTAVLAVTNLVRVTVLTPVVLLSATALFLITPAGGEVNWRMFVLVALTAAVFRLYVLLTLATRTTDIALSVVWEQTKLWAVLVSPAALILVLLLLLNGTEPGTNAWLYVAAVALAALGILSGISLYPVRRP